jgi:hypothetical protein
MLLGLISSIVDDMEATTMTKRIVSGVFLLIALGALGIILAGALTSGEQLIVRFLTAIIVAALCLYVISDLRLQADDGAMAGNSGHKPPVEVARRRASKASSLPPNSTAAFMATVTGKRSAQSGAGTAATSDDSPSADDTPLGDDSPLGEEQQTEQAPEPTADSTKADSTAVESTAAYTDDAVEAEAWPPVPDDEHDEVDTDDRLVAIFSKQAERDASRSKHDDEDEPHALVANDYYRPPMSTLPLPKLTSINGGATVAKALDRASMRADREGTATVDEDLDVQADDELVTLGDPHANPEPTDASIGEVFGRPVGEPVDDTDDDDARPAPASVAASPIRAVTAIHSAPGLEAAAYARARVISLLGGDEGAGDIDAAIRSGEIEIITSLMADGSLSDEGPISDRDVRTMVFVAFTSNELRKILRSGGSLDGDFDDLDLGPIEVFSTRSASTTNAAVGILASPPCETPADIDETFAVSAAPERQEPAVAGS